MFIQMKTNINKKVKNNIAIFVSGEGTNAISILNYYQNNYQRLKHFISVPLIVCDKRDAAVLRKLGAGVQFQDGTVCNVHLVGELSSDTKNVEKEILNLVEIYSIDWIFLAGFMRILSKQFLNAFRKNLSFARIVNIHPSLLPVYKGLDAYKRAYQDKVKIHGITIHFVNSDIDGGEIILQKKYKRRKNDTLISFVKRGKKIENETYPLVLDLIPSLTGVNNEQSS